MDLREGVTMQIAIGLPKKGGESDVLGFDRTGLGKLVKAVFGHYTSI